MKAIICKSGLDCPNIITCEKLKSKLKMMEISFEQINNSRNDLIKQLGEQEIINEKQSLKIKQLETILN